VWENYDYDRQTVFKNPSFKGQFISKYILKGIESGMIANFFLSKFSLLGYLYLGKSLRFVFENLVLRSFELKLKKLSG